MQTGTLKVGVLQGLPQITEGAGIGGVHEACEIHGQIGGSICELPS